VGLGNPGPEYAATRHNVGFRTVDRLREQTGGPAWRPAPAGEGEISEALFEGGSVRLAKPATYMNASGESVQLVAHFYGLTPADIVVVHDDKDLPLGTVRVQKDRSHAGHNGVRSVIEHLGRKDFLRVRIGIASQGHLSAADTAKFVLNKFSLFERTAAQKTVESAAMEIMALFV